MVFGVSIHLCVILWTHTAILIADFIDVNNKIAQEGEWKIKNK